MTEKLKKADYQRCADAGMTRAENAERLGVTVNAVEKMAARYKMQFKPAGFGRPTAASKAGKRVASFSASPAAIERALARVRE